MIENPPQGALAAIAAAAAIGIMLAGGVIAVLIVGIRIVVRRADQLHGLRLDIVGAGSPGQGRGCEAAQLVADGDSVAVARAIAIASGSVACQRRIRLV